MTEIIGQIPNEKGDDEDLKDTVVRLGLVPESAREEIVIKREYAADLVNPKNVKDQPKISRRRMRVSKHGKC